MSQLNSNLYFLNRKIFLLVSTRLMTVWSHYLWVKQVAEQEGKYLPSTAPCHPTPGKRFMIIRTEVDTVQPGLFMGFDSISRPFEHLAATNRNLVDDVPATSGSGKGSDKGNSYKKKWSLLGKVLSFTSPTAAAGVTSTTGQQANINSAGNRTWDDDSEPLRRGVSMLRARQATTAATTASTLSAATVASSTMPTTAMDQQPTSAAAVDQQGPPPPPPPPKQPPTSQQPGHMSSDSDSTGSSPIFDAAQFVFKFTLAWQPANAPPPRERILTRPRLPAPAQARVSAKMGPMRSGSPPPPAPGLPPPNRRISGLHDQNGGLVAEARNASPRIRPTEDDGNGGGRTSFSSIRAASLDLLRGERSTHERSASPTATATTSAAESATSGSRRAASPAGSTGSNSDSASNSPALRAQNSQHHQHQQQQVTQPIKPTGAGAIAGSKYAGRALAEWSIVVSECNSFVDRRRDEGVLGLSEVEVPSLGVDGFRKLG